MTTSKRGERIVKKGFPDGREKEESLRILREE